MRDAEPAPGTETREGICTGALGCRAATHIHGCYGAPPAPGTETREECACKCALCGEVKCPSCHPAPGEPGEGDDCQHESGSGDEGPVADLPGGWPVRWRCDGCGRIEYHDDALAHLRSQLAAARAEAAGLRHALTAAEALHTPYLGKPERGCTICHRYARLGQSLTDRPKWPCDTAAALAVAVVPRPVSDALAVLHEFTCLDGGHNRCRDLLAALAASPEVAP